MPRLCAAGRLQSLSVLLINIAAAFAFLPASLRLSAPRSLGALPRTATRSSWLTMADGDKTKVLFVCLGNICRSPTAEAMFNAVVDKAEATDKFTIDSCGTGGGNPNWYLEGGWSYHEGDPADARMTAAAAKRGVRLTSASRPLNPNDLDEFDLIVGMDAANQRAVMEAAEHWGKADAAKAKTRTMTQYCRQHQEKSVPDPYYGGPQGFEKVLDLLEDACTGLLEQWEKGQA